MTALVVFSFCLTATAQEGGQRRGVGMRGSMLGLLMQESVQKELKLTDEQLTKVREVGEKLRAEMRDSFAGLRDIQDAQERRDKMTGLSDEFDTKAREQLRDVLSREQMMRLFQIRLQVRGTLYALNNPRIARRLQLTEEQKQKAAELQKSTQEKVMAGYQGLRDVPEDQRRAKMEELRASAQKVAADTEKQALELLTPEQKTTLEQMKGAKIEL